MHRHIVDFHRRKLSIKAEVRAYTVATTAGAVTGSQSAEALSHVSSWVDDPMVDSVVK